MMHKSTVWLLLGSLALTSVLMSRIAGAPRPPLLPPIGLEEWRQSRQLPKRLILPHDAPDVLYNGVVISTPECVHLKRDPSEDFLEGGINGPDFPYFSVRMKPDSPQRCLLGIGKNYSHSPQASTHVPLSNGHIFDLAKGDVFPLYDQIYAVDSVFPNFILSVVTERVPAELRPGLETRTISTAAVEPELFVQQHPVYKGRIDFDYASIAFAEDGSKVVMKLEPRVGLTAVPLEGNMPKLPARPPLQVEVAKGGFLTARGRSYKVLNFVPPQNLEGVGHLVGWIELAADPVE